MIELQYQWHGPERRAELEAAGWEAVVRCTVRLWEECSKAVGISNLRPHKTPSQPGEPPRVRTGWGQRNIAYELDQQRGVGRVGVRQGAVYMIYLDQGTRRVAARPRLLATARKIYQELQQLAAGKGGSV